MKKRKKSMTDQNYQDIIKELKMNVRFYRDLRLDYKRQLVISNHKIGKLDEFDSKLGEVERDTRIDIKEIENSIGISKKARLIYKVLGGASIIAILGIITYVMFNLDELSTSKLITTFTGIGLSVAVYIVSSYLSKKCTTSISEKHVVKDELLDILDDILDDRDSLIEEREELIQRRNILITEVTHLRASEEEDATQLGIVSDEYNNRKILAFPTSDKFTPHQ